MTQDTQTQTQPQGHIILDTAPKPKYPPIPEGQYQAVLAEIVNFGEIQERFDEHPKHKLQLVFQLAELRDDGKRYEIRSFKLNASLHENATLRKQYLDRMLGGQRMNEILAQPQFDLTSLVGTNCTIEVTHKEGGQYANIGTIMRYFGSNPIAISADYVPVKERPGYVDPPKVVQDPEQAAAVQQSVQQVEQARASMQQQVAATPASQEPVTAADVAMLMQLASDTWGNAGLSKLEDLIHTMFGNAATLMKMSKDEAAQLIDRVRSMYPTNAKGVAKQVASGAQAANGSGGASVQVAGTPGDSVGDGGYNPFSDEGEPGWRPEGHPDIAAFNQEEAAVTTK